MTSRIGPPSWYPLPVRHLWRTSPKFHQGLERVADKLLLSPGPTQPPPAFPSTQASTHLQACTAACTVSNKAAVPVTPNACLLWDMTLTVGPPFSDQVMCPALAANVAGTSLSPLGLDNARSRSCRFHNARVVVRFFFKGSAPLRNHL